MPVNSAIPPTPWTDRVVASMRTGPPTRAGGRRMLASPAPQWEQLHLPTTPGDGDRAVVPTPVHEHPPQRTARSFAFGSEAKSRAGELASPASPRATPLLAGGGGTPGLTSLKAELDANQKLIALIESRMEAECERASCRSSAASSPARPSVVSRPPLQSQQQLLPTAPAAAHTAASLRGWAAGGDLSLQCSPAVQLVFQRDPTDDACRWGSVPSPVRCGRGESSRDCRRYRYNVLFRVGDARDSRWTDTCFARWGSSHSTLPFHVATSSSASAATTPTFGPLGDSILEGLGGGLRRNQDAPDSAHSARSATLSELEAMFSSPPVDAHAAFAPLSLNAAVGKAKKYKSHAKALNAKLQEQAGASPSAR
jgi:hypothetical protein